MSTAISSEMSSTSSESSLTANTGMQERPQKFNPPEIKGSQRVFFVGRTNSGKTYVARYLLKCMRQAGWRIVIVDPKKDWMGRGKEMLPFSDGTEKQKGTVDKPVYVVAFDPKLYVQIFQPVSWDASMEKVADDIMAVGNTIVYIDEVTQLVTGSHDPPRGLKIMITQGRSINVGVWVGTQRPVNVPILVKDQSEIWFIFRMANRKDREVVEGYVPVEETPELVEKPLPERYFWYWQDTMDKPILVAPLRIEENAKHRSEVR